VDYPGQDLGLNPDGFKVCVGSGKLLDTFCSRTNTLTARWPSSVSFDHTVQLPSFSCWLRNSFLVRRAMVLMARVISGITQQSENSEQRAQP